MKDSFWGNWDGDYDYKAPALEFEKRAGIAGVGRRYAIPRDHDMQSLEHEIKRRIKWADIPMEERQRRAALYARVVTRLNPELERVRYNKSDLGDTWTFLLGVTSGFNPDDIDWFINADREELRSGHNEELVARRLKGTFNACASMGWRVSHPTAILIIRKLNEKDRAGPAPQP